MSQGKQQMSGVPSTEIRESPPCVGISNVGLGTMRATGTYCALFLQTEEPGDRAAILVDVAKKLGISLQELSDAYSDTTCAQCGCLMSLHRDTGGQCP